MKLIEWVEKHKTLNEKLPLATAISARAQVRPHPSGITIQNVGDFVDLNIEEAKALLDWLEKNL